VIQQALLTKVGKHSWLLIAEPKKRQAGPTLAYAAEHVLAEVSELGDGIVACAKDTELDLAAELEPEPGLGLGLGLGLAELGSPARYLLQLKACLLPSEQRSTYPYLAWHLTPYVPSHQAGMALLHCHQHQMHSTSYARLSTIRSDGVEKGRS